MSRYNLKKYYRNFIITLLIFSGFTIAHAAGTYTYTYDDFYRLTKVEHSDGSITNYSYDKLGNRTSINIIPGTVSGGCQPPSSGDWIVQTDCELTGNVSPPANLIIENNSVLTITNGAVLNLDLSTRKIEIKKGSGLLIKQGGAIKKN